MTVQPTWFVLSLGELPDPYPRYRWFRENDPVHAVPATRPGDPGTWYLFRHADVERVLNSPHFGRSPAAAGQAGPGPAPVPAGYPALREVVGNWLVFLDPPRHTRLRALVTRRFTARVVEGLRPRIEEIADGLVAALRRRERTDLVADYAAPLPILVISELLGVPDGRRDWLRERAVALQEASTSRSGAGPAAELDRAELDRAELDRAERYGRAEDAARDLRDYFRAQVRRLRGHPGTDVTSWLARTDGPGDPLTDEELVGTCVHLLTAGHETTTNLISKSVLALLAHPGVLAELRADPGLMPGAVDELTRYDSPVQMVTRWAYRDEAVSGRTIPRGAKVVPVLGSANRDPERFADPDVLDVRRDAARHSGFGHGIHYCLGAGLARLEARIALTALLRGLPGLALDDEPVRYADDLVFHGPARLPLRTGTGRHQQRSRS